MAAASGVAVDVGGIFVGTSVGGICVGTKVKEALTVGGSDVETGVDDGAVEQATNIPMSSSHPLQRSQFFM